MKKYFAMIGKKYSYRIDTLSIQVIALDVRAVWGRIDILIEPCKGTGQKWIEINSLIA